MEVTIIAALISAASAIAVCIINNSANHKKLLTELEKRKTSLAKFDPLVWQATLNHMRVNPDCTVTFVFRDGTEVSRPIENGVRQYKKRRGTEGTTDDE